MMSLLVSKENAKTEIRESIESAIEDIKYIRTRNRSGHEGLFNHIDVPRIDHNILRTADDIDQLAFQTTQFILAANREMPYHGANDIDLAPLESYIETGEIKEETLHDMRGKLPMDVQMLTHKKPEINFDTVDLG